MRLKLVPDALMVVVGPGVGAILPVEEVVAFAPGTHPPQCPIRPDVTAVRCTVVGGRVRWYGFEVARINSHLRMEVGGFDPRFEEVSAWEDASVEEGR